MKLIGMLDSPFVRRTAISLRYLGIPFDHEAVSVFSTFAQFQAINPVVKAPTLVFDDGEILMDSTLIISFAESIADGKTLLPQDISSRRQALRIISFALAASEKAVQTVYEKKLRPAEKQYGPWLERLQNQLLAACHGLETDIARQPIVAVDIIHSQAFITAAVTWQFIQSMVADIVAEDNFPALKNLSAIAESLPEFLAFPPIGPGVIANHQ